MTSPVRDPHAQGTDTRNKARPGSEMMQARILRRFPQLVRDLGGEPADILAAHGLDCESCDREGAVTCSQWIGVLEQAAAELGVTDFGMRLAERQAGIDLFGPLGRVMRSSRTFGESLDHAVTHTAAHSLAVRLWAGRSASGQSVFIGHEVLAEGLSSRGQSIEHALLAGHLVAKALTGGRVGAQRVHFRHEAISDKAVYRRHFRCEVRFCCNEDGLAFAASDLAVPLVDPDAATDAGLNPDSLDDMIAFVETEYGRKRPTFQTQVRGVMMPLLWTGKSAVQDVARILELHPRSLHRRLREERSSFQAIKDEVRRDLLLYYLRCTDMPFAHIVEKLGFSEQSAMSRFVRSQFDTSPRELRRSYAGAQ
ncbi:AraC family transcriptional regulator ligand-binding domain-containing protein [Novosphingobium sp.]|uniref:AraC family transcriptional regulator ligand-binding domain-containing protein n=1 Tax=Novosphingobium sp. TaxID=1874826 RepID=UPI0028A811EC|nr:AraC family transcriptional regulator ligand-binding domain-containing protein [Novosphingobium sp.]